MTVRYWASARAAAGRTEDHVSGESLAEVLAAAGAVHDDNPRFAQVLAISSFLIGEQPVGMRDPAEVPLRGGDVVEVLPPFAGG